MSQTPFDSSVEAEYADGFILSETDTDDTSSYQHLIPKDEQGNPLEGNNTFSDILNKRPEADHGKMVRFSVYWHNARYDINWSDVPENSRPIRFRDRSSFLNDNGETGVTDWHGCRFGYQFTDDNGKNQQMIKEL